MAFKEEIILKGKDLVSPELKKAQKSVKKLGDQTKKSNQVMSSGFKSSALSLAKYAAGFAGLSAAIGLLKASTASGIENEQEMVNLARQVNATDSTWAEMGSTIDDVIQKQANYAVLTRTETSVVLRRLILITGDTQKATDNLALTLDLATAANLDNVAAAQLVGRALEGDIEALGRYFPQIKALTKELGRNATAEEKAARGMEILRQKTNGAAGAIDGNIRRIRESGVAWEQLKDAIGGVILELTSANPAFTKALEGAEDFFVKIKFLLKDSISPFNIQDLKFQIEELSKQKRLLKLTDVFPDSLFKTRNDILNKQISDIESRIFTLKSRIARIQGEQNERKKGATIPKSTKGSKARTPKKTELELLQTKKQSLVELDQMKAKFNSKDESFEFFRISRAIELLDIEREIALMKSKNLGGGKALEGGINQFFDEAKTEERNADAERKLEQEQLGRDISLQAQRNFREQVELEEGEHQERLGAMVLARAQIQMRAEERLKNTKIRAAQDSFSAASNLSNALFVATGSRNKALFKATKAFNIANAIMDTYAGATKAMVKPGGFAGQALAASIITAGLLNVATISRTTMGGGAGGGGGSTGTASSSVSVPTGFPRAGQFDSGGSSRPQITVNLTLQSFDAESIDEETSRRVTERLMPAIAEGLGDHIGNGGSTGATEFVVTTRGA